MKKIFKFVIAAVSVCLIACSMLGSVVLADGDAPQGIMDVSNWSGSVTQSDNKVHLDGNAYTTAPIGVVEDYIRIDYEIAALPEDDQVWISFCVINSSIMCSPAGLAKSDGLYFLVYNKGGNICISLQHVYSGASSVEYKGMQDIILGANPIIGQHSIEILFVGSDTDDCWLYIDGIPYKRALLTGVYIEDVADALTMETYLSFSKFGSGSDVYLTGASVVNGRDMESPSINPNMPAQIHLNKECIVPTPIVTDNVDSSFAVTIEVYDPDGLKIFLKDGKFTPSKEGDYIIRYSTQDCAGNEAVKAWKVNVIKGGGCRGSNVLAIVIPTMVAILGTILIKK